MKYRALTLLLLLCACGTAPAPCPVLPVPRHYTAAQERQIAAEHNQLPPDDILRDVMDEWETTRRALR